MDTDVELIKNIDDLLENKAFFGFENARAINTGIGFGAEKESLIVRKLLEDYMERVFSQDGKINLSMTCAHINTQRLESEFPDLKKNDRYQNFDGIVFLPSDYMNPGENINEYSISVHHSARSWLGNFDKKMIKKHGKFKTKILSALREPVRCEMIKNRFGTKAEKIYIFVIYDFMDLGVVYFMKKFKNGLTGRRKR